MREFTAVLLSIEGALRSRCDWLLTPTLAKGGWGDFLKIPLRWRCGCAAADATAWQQMEGFRPLHDEQEGRFRTASLHPPAAPNDHHHR